MPSNASSSAPVAFLFDRPLSYAPVQRLQQELVEARAANRIPDSLLLLEHLPVVTVTGAKARAHLRATPAELQARGIELAESTRGGDVTYHAPGQWVLYPILRLEGAAANVHAYVAALEEIAIRSAAGFGVRAYRRAGKTGAWTDGGKLAAIGVRVRGWVTCHGLSFNADIALDGFAAIIPCGLHGEAVCSLRTLLGGAAPGPPAVRKALLRHACDVLQRAFVRRVVGGGGGVPSLSRLFPAD